MAVVVLSGEHTLYKLLDHDQRLLYVGITNNLPRRLAAHQRQQWWREVATTEAITLPNRRAALAEEERLIVTERPPQNKALNPDWKRPVPSPVLGSCRRCRTQQRLDVHGFIRNHNRLGSGQRVEWCDGTGRTPGTA